VTSLVLAGERDRAAARAEEIERKYESLAAEMRQHWEGLSADIESTCAKYHAKEAATVKAMKLERFWEPSPFPVELPASERESKSAERLFVTQPWPAPPSWLWQALPDAPGSICYAKKVLCRTRDLSLLVALSPEEAGQRHHEREAYVLAARLDDGLLALIRRSTIYDQRSPDKGEIRPRPPPHIAIELQGRAHHASTYIWDSNRETGICHVTGFSVLDRATSRVWECQLNLGDGTKTIWDGRSGKRIYTVSALTDAERKAAVCPIPAFGEYATAVECFRLVLRAAGFGDVS